MSSSVKPKGKVLKKGVHKILAGRSLWGIPGLKTGFLLQV